MTKHVIAWEYNADGSAIVSVFDDSNNTISRTAAAVVETGLPEKDKWKK